MVFIGFGLNEYNFLSHVGFAALAVSYLRKDMVHLRTWLCLANVGLVAWGIIALSGGAAYSAAGWNTLFFIINARRLHAALKARRPKKEVDNGKSAADATMVVPTVAALAAPPTHEPNEAKMHMPVRPSPASPRRRSIRASPRASPMVLRHVVTPLLDLEGTSPQAAPSSAASSKRVQLEEEEMQEHA